MSKNLRKSDANIFSVNNVEPTIENQRRTVIAQDFFIILYVKNLRKSNTNMEPTIEDQMIDGHSSELFTILYVKNLRKYDTNIFLKHVHRCIFWVDTRSSNLFYHLFHNVMLKILFYIL